VSAATLNTDRLGKLLALLTSDHDGEVVAAARAACRLLAAADLRPEDLADPGKLFRATYQLKPAPARPEPPPPPSVSGMTARQVREVIAHILTGEVSEADRAFLTALSARLFSAPHQGITTAEVRKVNKLWRIIDE